MKTLDEDPGDVKYPHSGLLVKFLTAAKSHIIQWCTKSLRPLCLFIFNVLFVFNIVLFYFTVGVKSEVFSSGSIERVLSSGKHVISSVPSEEQ